MLLNSSVRPHETGRRVAIKAVFNVFHDLIDAKRVLREVRACADAWSLSIWFHVTDVGCAGVRHENAAARVRGARVSAHRMDAGKAAATPARPRQRSAGERAHGGVHFRRARAYSCSDARVAICIPVCCRTYPSACARGDMHSRMWLYEYQNART